MNTELNAFLALLEDRPETFREILQGTRRADLPARNIQERIHQAAENLKCQAVKQAIREIYRTTLRLRPSDKSPAIETLAGGGNKEAADLCDAFYAGVEAVEELLQAALEACERTEKNLGPPHQTVP